MLLWYVFGKPKSLSEPPRSILLSSKRRKNKRAHYGRGFFLKKSSITTGEANVLWIQNLSSLIRRRLWFQVHSDCHLLLITQWSRYIINCYSVVTDMMHTCHWGIIQGFYCLQKVHYMIHTCFMEPISFITHGSRLIHYDLLAIADFEVSYSIKHTFYNPSFQYWTPALVEFV